MRYLFLLLYVTIHLVSLQAQTRTGRDYAVFLYCTDFQPGLAPLPETKTEATALKTELETSYGFTCELVANPTKQQIRDKIRAYNARMTPNDQVLFFFSMHGHYTEDGERGYLIPKDGEAGDDYGDTWLSYDDLRTDLAPCKAKHVLLALDACYSGTFGTRNRTIPSTPVFTQEDDCQTKMNKVMQYTGRQYCSSGNKTAKTPAKSLFAARFLEALRKGGENGILHFDTDLEYYLKKADNPRPETGSFGKHAPGADFMFLRTDACSLQTNADAAFKAPANPAPRKLETPAPQRIDDTDRDLDLVWIEGGTYTMGCTSEQQDCGKDEQPTHTVQVSDFFLGQFEVTQKRWKAVMGSNPSYFKNCPDCPVEQVNWEDVQIFLKKLNDKYPGKNYRLPTEAEWEYAAREGGQAVLFGHGKNMLDPAQVNFNARITVQKAYCVAGDYRAKTVPVGSLRSPNTLGLHDLSGNVWEWCSDWQGDYSSGMQQDPTGPGTGSVRMLRGGSWSSHPEQCRVAVRHTAVPSDRAINVGFRIARSK